MLLLNGWVVDSSAIFLCLFSCCLNLKYRHTRVVSFQEKREVDERETACFYNFSFFPSNGFDASNYLSFEFL